MEKPDRFHEWFRMPETLNERIDAESDRPLERQVG
jgi:hypothetical protein